MSQTKKEAPQQEAAIQEQTQEMQVQTQEAAQKNPLEELVTIRLFKDNERYRDDVFVSVNGRTFQIKRGVEVQVPRYVQEVLENSMSQDMVAAAMVDKLEAGYKQKSGRQGPPLQGRRPFIEKVAFTTFPSMQIRPTRGRPKL